MKSPIDFRELPSNPRFYEKNASGLKFDGEEVPAYDLNFSSMGVIADHYQEKYDINIKIVEPTDYEEGVLEASLTAFLDKELENILRELEETKKPVAYILNNLHTVPMIFSKNAANQLQVTCLDSIGHLAVASIDYFDVAEKFPEVKFFLNNGQRQMDMASCRIDALAILKDALQLDSSEITARLTDVKPRSWPSMPNNMQLFNLPEKLLKTNQTREYPALERADKNSVITKKGLTLAQKIAKHSYETTEIKDLFF